MVVVGMVSQEQLLQLQDLQEEVLFISTSQPQSQIMELSPEVAEVVVEVVVEVPSVLVVVEVVVLDIQEVLVILMVDQLDRSQLVDLVDQEA